MNEWIMLATSASVAALSLFLGSRIRNRLTKKSTGFDKIALYAACLCGALQAACMAVNYKEFHMTANGGAGMAAVCFLVVILLMELLKKEKRGMG